MKAAVQHERRSCCDSTAYDHVHAVVNPHGHHAIVAELLACPHCARLLWEHIERIQRTHERATEPQPA